MFRNVKRVELVMIPVLVICVIPSAFKCVEDVKMENAGKLENVKELKEAIERKRREEERRRKEEERRKISVHARTHPIRWYSRSPRRNI